MNKFVLIMGVMGLLISIWFVIFEGMIYIDGCWYWELSKKNLEWKIFGNALMLPLWYKTVFGKK